MQEIRYDGSQRLTVNPTEKEISAAISNIKNKTVLIHKPGSIIEMSDGQRYEVGPSGNWKKIS